MSEQTTTPSPKRGFGFIALLAAALVGLVGGGLASTAIGHGMGRGHGGWGHHGMMGPMDPASAQEHAEHMVGHLSWAIDAASRPVAASIAVACHRRARLLGRSTEKGSCSPSVAAASSRSAAAPVGGGHANDSR